MDNMGQVKMRSTKSSPKNNSNSWEDLLKAVMHIGPWPFFMIQ